MSPTNTRVSGHELQYEGAAFEKIQGHSRPRRITWNTVSGIGRGWCSCGLLSEVLPSGAARKSWHREHKKDVSA